MTFWLHSSKVSVIPLQTKIANVKLLRHLEMTGHVDSSSNPLQEADEKKNWAQEIRVVFTTMKQKSVADFIGGTVFMSVPMYFSLAAPINSR